MNVLELPFHAVYDVSDPPDACLWEPANNDLDPSPTSDPGLGDYDLLFNSDYEAMAIEEHLALMGGWCFDHPDRPDGEPWVGRYVP